FHARSRRRPGCAKPADRRLPGTCRGEARPRPRQRSTGSQTWGRRLSLLVYFTGAISSPRYPMNTLSVMRRWLLAVLGFGLVGTGADLILTKHYETAAQAVPLASIALALAVLIWHGIKGDG